MMKKLIRLMLLPVIIMAVLIFSSCEKDKKSGLPTDGDGNEYDTVVIGTQVWLTENLKTTTYNEGTPIPLAKENETWTSMDHGAYCWYMNNPDYKDTYGAIYNWYAAQLYDFICPVGYHVPTKDEWTSLANYMMGAPDDVKESFKIKPVGWRIWNGSFDGGLIGDWWISSSDGSSYSVGQDFSIAGMGKRTGYSVRCIKNN